MQRLSDVIMQLQWKRQRGYVMTRAAQVFDDMQARGVEADVVTCCSLISALERGGQWQLAEVRVAPAAARTLLMREGESGLLLTWPARMQMKQRISVHSVLDVV